MFNISIVDHSPNATPLCFGQIQLGSFVENFQVVLEYWTVEDYQLHWYDSIIRAAVERKNSCLITSITNPETANFFFWWPIYVEEQFCIFQNAVFFTDRNEAFNIANPYASIRPRISLTDDGEAISEWKIHVNALNEWLSSQNN